MPICTPSGIRARVHVRMDPFNAGLRPAHQYTPVSEPWWKRFVAPLLVVLVIGGIVAVVARAKAFLDDAYWNVELK